jgi:hypothetical protein
MAHEARRSYNIDADARRHGRYRSEPLESAQYFREHILGAMGPRFRGDDSELVGRQQTYRAPLPACSHSPIGTACAAPALARRAGSGSVNEKRAPPPWFEAEMRPPCASTIERQIDRPRPMPPDLVV